MKRDDLMQRRRKLTPYQKIARAAMRGTGVWLTPDEVGHLSDDTTIKDRAAVDDDDPHEAVGESRDGLPFG